MRHPKPKRDDVVLKLQELVDGFENRRIISPKDQEALKRILDATTSAGGKLINNRGWEMWPALWHTCAYKLANTTSHTERKAQLQCQRRIFRAALKLQRELALFKSEGPDKILSWEIRALREPLENLLKAFNPELTTFALRGSRNLLTHLVGELAGIYAYHFGKKPGYTTDPSNGETDGPFIRFVEQTLHEFGITRDGNQPYMRSSIADALTNFKKRAAPKREKSTF